MINRGRTFPWFCPFPEFREEHVRAVAIENMKKRGIDALVVIGGDGSYMGAKRLDRNGLSMHRPAWHYRQRCCRY